MNKARIKKLVMLIFIFILSSCSFVEESDPYFIGVDMWSDKMATYKYENKEIEKVNSQIYKHYTSGNLYESPVFQKSNNGYITIQKEMIGDFQLGVREYRFVEIDPIEGTEKILIKFSGEREILRWASIDSGILMITREYMEPPVVTTNVNIEIVDIDKKTRTILQEVKALGKFSNPYSDIFQSEDDEYTFFGEDEDKDEVYVFTLNIDSNSYNERLLFTYEEAVNNGGKTNVHYVSTPDFCLNGNHLYFELNSSLGFMSINRINIETLEEEIVYSSNSEEYVRKMNCSSQSFAFEMSSTLTDGKSVYYLGSGEDLTKISRGGLLGANDSYVLISKDDDNVVIFETKENTLSEEMTMPDGSNMNYFF